MAITTPPVPMVTLHFSPLPPPQCLRRHAGGSGDKGRGESHATTTTSFGRGPEGSQEMFLATGLAAAAPGWVVMSEPTSSHHRHHHHDDLAASDELCFPVGVAWDRVRDRRDKARLHVLARDFSTVATARLGELVAAGTDLNGDSEVTAVSSNLSIHRVRRHAAATTCDRVEFCPSRGLMLGASSQELHLSLFSQHKKTRGGSATAAPESSAAASAAVPFKPEEIALTQDGKLAFAVGGGVLAMFSTSGSGGGRGRGDEAGRACAMEELAAMKLPSSKGKVLRARFITSRRGRVAVLLVQAGESEGVSAISVMVECVNVSSSSASDEGDGAGGFRLALRSSAKMVINAGVSASSATAAEWDEWGREVVLGALGGALSVHPRGRPDGDEKQVAPVLRIGRVPGGGTPTLLRWGKVGGDAVLAVAVEGGGVAMMLPSLQPLNLVSAPSTSPYHLIRALTPATAHAAVSAPAPAVVPGAEGRVALVTPRVSASDDDDDDDNDEIAFIEWDDGSGRGGGSWGRLAVVFRSGCSAVIDVAPDAATAACGESRGALGLASAARDLPALEDLMIGIMRRGGGSCGRAAGDPAAAAMALTAAASASWRISQDKEKAAALIRRVVQWRAGRGDIEGAYSLAHMTGDRASLEDVYCAALRQGNDGVAMAIRDRIFGVVAGEDKTSDETSSSSSSSRLISRGRVILPSMDELARLAALEAHAAAAAVTTS